MVLAAMNSGVSGLQAESDALGVVGDNIANVNTVGFKSQRAVFEDVLGHSILAGTGTNLPGSGVKVGDVQQMFTQGTLQNTGVSTDIALNGDGFFVVKGAVDGVSSNFYTRSGEFSIDKDGNLANTDGLKVQGYQSNGDGTFAASISNVTAPTAALPAKATTALTVTANIDSDATVPALPFDPQDPANTSNFSTTMSVYDSLGNAHTMDVYFAKTAANTWDYHAIVPGADLNPPVVGNSEVGTGSLAFTTNGALNTVTTGTAITASFAGATAAQADRAELRHLDRRGRHGPRWHHAIRGFVERLQPIARRLCIRRFLRRVRRRSGRRHWSLHERPEGCHVAAGDCQVPLQRRPRPRRTELVDRHARQRYCRDGYCR